MHNEKAITNLYVLRTHPPDPLNEGLEETNFFLISEAPSFQHYGCSFQNGWHSIKSIAWPPPSFFFLLYKPLLDSNKKG